MAGGVGSRFWPLSRQKKPKQFLDILGTGRTLLQMTFDRFSGICPVENFLVITSAEYIDLVQEQLPQLKTENIIGEPARRNTAPCVAYAAFLVKKKNPAATMVVTPADHFVTETESFRDIISHALTFAKDKMALVTVGITPTRPETGYGYIQECTENDVEEGVKKVKTFTEKPDLKMAKIFIESGEFLWNAGIFVWSVKSIMYALKKYMPEMYFLFDDESKYYTSKEREFIENVYTKVKAISIDYGIMEKAEDVYVLPASIGWSDLGTWGSLFEHSEKDENRNVFNSENVKIYNSSECIVKVQDSKLVVLNSVDNLIVAEANGLLLISNKDEEQKIRQIVNDIKLDYGDDSI